MVERNLAKVEVESSRLFSRSKRFTTEVPDAGVAQLVERNLAKVEVESSRLFSRSSYREASLLVLLRQITGRFDISSLPQAR